MPVSVRTPQDLGKALQRAVAGLVLVAQWHGGCAMDKAEGPDLLDPHTTIGEVHGCRSHRHDVRAPVCTTIDCSVAELVFHKKESCRAGDRQQQLALKIQILFKSYANPILSKSIQIDTTPIQILLKSTEQLSSRPSSVRSRFSSRRRHETAADAARPER